MFIIFRKQDYKMKFKFKTIDLKDAPDAYQDVEIDFSAKLRFPSDIGDKFVKMTTKRGTVIWLDWSIVTSFILD